MPSSQAAATERRNDRMMAHEPPKLKTILKTPPKQATNPMQFVKVGPCSLYRTAQEQLSKVQEVKKIKQEVRDDPEDWQSNLDNWKSSRRKRQEHIIERVVEVKKLELEEHDRQRRRSKTFSEMMEERGSRGRKLSMSLAMYHEEDSNDLSDLGIGTSSGKSSVSGDTHDDNQSVLSDRDSEIDKNHSDLDNATSENGNNSENNNIPPKAPNVKPLVGIIKKPFDNGFHNDHDQREYDSGTTATASSPEPEEYTYEGAIRGYVNRVAHSIPRHSLLSLEAKLESTKKANLSEEKFSTDEKTIPVVKVDVLKRREIFEKASMINADNKINNNMNNRSSGDFTNSTSIKERSLSLEKQKQEAEQTENNCKALSRLAGDMSSIRERLSHLEKQTSERENKVTRKIIHDTEGVRPLRDRLSILEKYADDTLSAPTRTSVTPRQNRENFMDESKSADKQMSRIESAPSERSSSPDSEYRAPRAAFHRSLDSLDADASSGPDTFERVQSLEDLEYARSRYPASASSAEILNDTDREDSGIHTADVSCSVSQADEPVDEDIVQHTGMMFQTQEIIAETEEPERQQQQELENVVQPGVEEFKTEMPEEKCQEKVDTQQQSAVIIEGTAEASGKLPTNKSQIQSTGRTVIYQTPRVPPRTNPPELFKPHAVDNNLIKTTTIEPVADVDTKIEKKFMDLKVSTAIESTITVNKPSKIPTPLPRKPMNIKITSSTGTPPGSPVKNSPKSTTTTFFFAKLPTKIPSPVKIQDDTVTNQENSSNENFYERRRTIVEICEKIVVPQSETPIPPVTPFITVTKIGDEEQLNTSEKSIVIGTSSSSSSSNDEEAVPRAESPPMPVEHEEDTKTSGSTVSDNSPVVCSKVSLEQDVQRETVVTSPAVIPLTYDSNESFLFDKSSIPSAMEFMGSALSLPKSIPPLNLANDEEIVAGLTFPLGPPSSVEPPKEKPPPPPTDLSDEENQPVEPLKRLNSTRRIKKELRTRRSDFLGIEGQFNDYDFELTLAKPPDMAAILAEERRIEQLHRRSYDTDSNYEQDSSHERDSGVELGHAEDWVKQPVSPDMSQHSRQSSEPFGASVTSSEEDEITKKEREIIEVLEKEEQWRYGDDREQNSDIGEKLAHKLRELEEEKMQLERERAQEAELQRQEETLRKNDENARKQEEELLRKQQQETVMQQEAVRTEEMKFREEEMRIEAERLRLHDEIIEKERSVVDIRRQDDIHMRSMKDKIREQENTVLTAVLCNHEDDYVPGDVLRVERELLQLEQEELKRQRNNMAYREAKQQKLAEQLQEQWQSLQDVTRGSNIAHATYQNINVMNYRSSMPNLQLQDVQQRRRLAPPPIPPAKPLRLLDQRQRDVTIRNSRIPSADSIPQQVDATMRHSISATTLATHAGQQMTKQTLQALSAAPRSRIVKGDQWVQRRKSDGPRATQDLNYQHWLIQEAEQRRINEKNQRSPARKPQQHITGTSVPYSTSPAKSKSEGKPLPDSIIQTLTQRMQNRAQERLPPARRRIEHSVSQEHLPLLHHQQSQHHAMMHQKVHQSPTASSSVDSQEKMLSVSGRKKCSHCGDELGRGAAMIIESLRLFYHMECFKCCVCHVRLGDGLMGTDVRVRNHKLHCHNCYSSDDGVKFSCV